MYAAKFKTDVSKLQEKLWGDNYFDAEGKKWKSEGVADNGKPLKRAFCSFIMDPIIKLCSSIMDGNAE